MSNLRKMRKRKRKMRRLSGILLFTPLLTIGILTLLRAIDVLVMFHHAEIDISDAHMPSYKLWVVYDPNTTNFQADWPLETDACFPGAAQWVQTGMDISRKRSASHPAIETFIRDADVNPVGVQSFFQALLGGAKWIFITKRDLKPHSSVDIADVADKTTVYGMAFCSPGVFETCRHFVSEEVTSQTGRTRPKSKTSDYYVVRQVSPHSARVLTDDCASMTDAVSPPAVIMPGTFASVSMDSVLLHQDLFWLSILHHIDVAESQPLAELQLAAFLQRLLWETEHQLILLNPTLTNAKVSSLDLTTNVTKDTHCCGSRLSSDFHSFGNTSRTFIQALSDMRCTSDDSTFLECALELVGAAFPDGFEHGSLKKILRLWFHTLNSLNYQFPLRVPLNNGKLLNKRWGIPSIYTPPKSKPYYQLRKHRNYAKTDWRPKAADVLIVEDDPDISEDFNKDGDLQYFENNMGINTNFSKTEKNDEMPADILDLVSSKRERLISENEFTSLCRSVNTSYKPVTPQRFKYDRIVLVIVFNFPYLASHIPKLLTMYGRHFKHMLFCGEKIHSLNQFYSAEDRVRISFVQINHQRGHWAYSCTAAAIKMGYRASGFLQISDDLLLNVWNLRGLPLDKPWFQPRVRVADVRMRRVPDIATTSRWFPWIFGAGRLAAQLALRTLRGVQQPQSAGHKVQKFMQQLLTTTGCGECLMYEASDIFYIPGRMKEDYVFFADLFHRHRLHLELAVPTILFGLAPEHHIVRLRGNYLWGEGPRAQFLKYYSLYDHFQHAWKLTRLADQGGDGGGGLRFFCRVFLPRVDADLTEVARRDREGEKNTDKRFIGRNGYS